MNDRADTRHNGPADSSQDQSARPANGLGAKKPETTPAEERGERLDTGKHIARGGKSTGHVPGAEPSHGKDEGR